MRVKNYQFWQEWREKTKITEKQIDKMFSRLYEGEKPTVLLRELLINRTYNSPFVEHFPPLFCNSLCRLCGFQLFAYRSDKAHYRKTQLPYNILTAHCLNCGHQENMLCECLECFLNTCENNKIIENNKKCIEEGNEEALFLHKKFIFEIYNYCSGNFQNIPTNSTPRALKFREFNYISINDLKTNPKKQLFFLKNPREK